MNDPSCPFCPANVDAAQILWEDEHWYVRHAPAPYGIAGWMTLYTKRHVAGPAYFDEPEAASFGPRLSHLERALEEITGALRIYTASMNEGFEHVHVHMVPRYAEMPGNVRTWGVFDLQRRAKLGEVTVDEAAVADISARYRERLAKSLGAEGSDE